MRIGFFDSGHGGLDILQEALRRYDADYFFIADSAHHPYGAMAIDVLEKRCLELSKILIEDKGCEMVVVACNTATAYAIEFLRKKYTIPFVGVEPYLNYINRAAPDKLAHGQVGALVTPNTLRSQRFKELKQAKDPQGLVHVVALANLAPAIEAFVFHRDSQRFEKELTAIFKEEDFSLWKEAILGCTHYPLIAKHIEKNLGIKTVSPTAAIIDQMLRVLGAKETLREASAKPFAYCDTKTDIWREALITDFLPLP